MISALSPRLRLVTHVLGLCGAYAYCHWRLWILWVEARLWSKNVTIIYQCLRQPYAAFFRAFKALGVSCLETRTFQQWNQDFPAMKLRVSYWSFREAFLILCFVNYFSKWFTSSQVHKFTKPIFNHTIIHLIIIYCIIYIIIYIIQYIIFLWLLVPFDFTFCELVNLWTLSRVVHTLFRVSCFKTLFQFGNTAILNYIY